MKNLIDILEKCIRNNGALIALSSTEGHTITYDHLGKSVRKFASEIQSCLLQPTNNTIVVISERDILMPVFLYSIIYSGNSYLPVDYRFPPERVRSILEDAKPNAVIIQNKYLENFEINHGSIIHSKKALTNDFSLVLLKYEIPPFNNETVYVLYTSGSTGKPKGVVHTHKSVMAFLGWCNETIPVSKEKNFIWISPLHFDLSVFDIFMPLFRNGCLLVVKEEEIANQRMLAQIIAVNKINYIYATPSFFKLLCDVGKLQQYDYGNVNCILIAGEQLHWELLEKLKVYFIKSVFYNFYGPTETNVCLFYKVDFHDREKYPEAVPIGKVCACDEIFLQEYESDGLFELWVSGDTLMRGYAGNEDARFEMKKGKLHYKTGDIVKKIFDDNLVFLGRADRMIKKNGYRIEPAEIERYIKQLDGVKNAIALALKIKNNTKLVIFIQADIKYTLLEIKQYCLGKLPFYMMPDDIVYLDELPLNLNYKTDTQRLADSYAG